MTYWCEYLHPLTGTLARRVVWQFEDAPAIPWQDRLVNAADQKPNSLSPAESADGWTLLFDGKTLAGWNAADMSYWSVEDGAITGTFDGHLVDCRVSTLPSIFGEKIVMRVLDKGNLNLNLDSLGLEPDILDKFKAAIDAPHGMMLMTGPTGSGKTSTMYASLSYIMQRDGTSVSISTVEDPVEFNLPMISQSQINPAQEFTYPRALRSLMAALAAAATWPSLRGTSNGAA